MRGRGQWRDADMCSTGEEAGKKKALGSLKIFNTGTIHYHWCPIKIEK